MTEKLSKLLLFNIFIVFSIAFLVLVGWQFDIEILKRPLPNLIAMNPMTAILFILSTIIIFFFEFQKDFFTISKKFKSITINILGLCIFLVGLLRFIAISTGFNLGIDSILFSNKLQTDVINGVSNTMGLITAINFIMLSIALLLTNLNTKSSRNIANYLCLIVLIIGLYTFIGYIYQLRGFFVIIKLIGTAVHTAICFMIISLVLLIVNSDYGFMYNFTSKYSGGRLARILIPFTFVVPITLGYIRLYLDWQHHISVEFGVTILISSIIISFITMIWYVALTLNKIDVSKTIVEGKFKNIVELLNEGITESDVNGIISYCNEKLSVMTEYDKDEIIGTSVLDMIDKDWLRFAANRLQKRIEGTPESNSTEIKLRTKTGKVLWVLASSSNFYDSNGNLTIFSVSRDITDRKIAEEKLKLISNEIKERNATLNSILESVGSMVFAFDKNFNLLFFNKAYKKIVLDVYKENINIGDNIYGLIQKVNTGQEYFDNINKCYNGETTIQYLEIFRDENIIYYEIFLNPISLDTGEIIGITQLINNITKRKKDEQSLIETNNELHLAKMRADDANIAKSTFLANMSHEIRTPMNAILGFAEILSKSEIEARYKEFASTILRSGKSLLSLINDILDLSKIEAGKMDIFIEPVNLKNILEEVEQIFRIKIYEKGLNFNIIINPVFPKFILIDESKIRQIMINLIGNSIKFTHNGYINVNINFSQVGKYHLDFSIMIQDSGIGIPLEKQNLVFEAFRQQDEQSTRTYGGTGLGLTITKKLVELLGGTISLQSQVNVGTTFELEFNNIPLINKNESHYKNKIELNADYIFKKNKILLVEDIEDNVNLFNEYLRKYDFEIEIAFNGKAALEKLTKFRPEIIFMDIHMPEMDGFTATKIIKENKELNSIPVVAFTASVMKEEIEKIYSLFDDYLQKPLSSEMLESILLKYLRHDKINLDSLLSNNISEENEIIEFNEKIKLNSKLKIELNNSINPLINALELDKVYQLCNELENFPELSLFVSKLRTATDEFDGNKVSILLNKLLNFINE